jgi:hypothetical protein
MSVAPSSPPTPSGPSMPLYAALATAAIAIGLAVGFITGRSLAGLALVVAGVGFALVPRVHRRRARRVAFLAGAGREASALVISVHQVHSRGAVPRVRVEYEITPSGKAPYRLTTRHLVPPGMESTFVPGAVLTVRVDPSNPKNVVFVTGSRGT